MKCLTAFAFYGDLAVNVLSLVDGYPFFVELFNDLDSVNFFTQRLI